MRYVFFVNPVAGKGVLQKKLITDIEQYFEKKGAEYKIVVTHYKGEAEKVARREAETGDTIVMFACGGEGTGYEVINGIVGFDNVTLGVIPCGSANDFVRGFGNIAPFWDLAAQTAGEAVKMDLIRAGDHYCLNGCSVGMDAMVAKDMSLFKRWPLVSGSFAYQLAIVKNFVKKLGVQMRVWVDGEPLGEVRCLFTVIANGPYYGGGYMAAPDAVPNDGKLDFSMVKVISKLRVPKFLSLYKKGQHKQLPYCMTSTCREMEFRADTPIPVNLDGEIVETKHMRFLLVKNAIRFLVPAGVRMQILTNI